MNDSARRTALGLLLLATCAPGQAPAQFREDMDIAETELSGRTPESIIIVWPTYSYRLARMMIARYGQPAEAGDLSLVWHGNGPWKKTVVYRDLQSRGLFRRAESRLEQTVDYEVPADNLRALARFDEKIEADPKAGTLTSISDSEADNFLALNLAHEVLQGRRTPADASEFRRKQLRLRDAGKSSPYLERLLFAAAR